MRREIFVVNEISKGLKILFLLEVTVGYLFGIIYFGFTEVYIDIVGWPYYDPIAGRVLGISLLTYGTCSLIAFLRKDWITAKIVIELQIIWHILILGVQIVGAIIFNLWDVIWFLIVILAPFLVAFLYFYITEPKRIG